ncbi:acyltransferase family protein [Micromonospora cathayae]|uniref:Acyltransferase family protein n=1 Tax=Micromonospora cathayae TaxID=3028804 RepID=A0ABY7ZZC6_9ACTN|nr:acyltransferase [Micromonospora sp. HUAS 3]WDZ87798.1 acyltransferase family protein [Micromonospora sp. HUAS 3]
MTSLAPAAGVDRSLHRLPSLTGLRWIAAMLVFGFHVGTMRIIVEPGHKAVVDQLFTLGLSGVQFFYILSGFVLVWSARPQDTKWGFWRRRLAKIYPNHVVLWALVLLVGLWFADPFNGSAAMQNLFLIQAWNPTPGYFYSVNTVSWSLSCELFFYLCLPFALPVIRRMRPWALWAVVVAVPLVILALWPGQLLVPEQDRWWFTQVFPLVRSTEFWMGVAAAELMRRGHWRGPGLPLASLIFVVTWLVAGEWIRAEFWAALLSVAYILIITSAARADVRGLPSPWRSRPMVWLGEVSFAFYLVHVFVMITVLRLTGHHGVGFTGWTGLLVVVGFLLVNLLLAWLLYRWVETPMMRLLAPARKRSAPPGAPSTPAGGTDRPRQSTPAPGSAPEPAASASGPGSEVAVSAPGAGAGVAVPRLAVPSARRPGNGTDPDTRGIDAGTRRSG